MDWLEKFIVGDAFANLAWPGHSDQLIFFSGFSCSEVISDEPRV